MSRLHKTSNSQLTENAQNTPEQPATNAGVLTSYQKKMVLKNHKKTKVSEQDQIQDINTILLVLDPGDFSLSNPMQSSTLQRALWLARENHAHIHILHVLQGLSFASSQQREADIIATKLAECLIRAPLGSIPVTSEVAYAPNRVEAIHTRAKSVTADLIIKRYQEKDFVIGLQTHDDWALLRESTVPVWFVKSDSSLAPSTGERASVLAAIGRPNSDRAFVPNDYSVVSMAQKLSSDMASKLRCVHYYQHDSAAPLPSVLAAFAQFMHIPEDSFVVERGRRQKRLPELANKNDARLLVIGASKKSYWQRLFSDVVCEPVLSSSKVDVLFVPDTSVTKNNRNSLALTQDNVTVSRQDNHPEAAAGYGVTGRPEVDFKQAFTNPSELFDTPEDVLHLKHVSDLIKYEILDAWLEQAMRAQLLKGPSAQATEYRSTTVASITAAMNSLDCIEHFRQAA